MAEDQKVQLLESIAERERKEQQIVDSAKVRAKAMADRLRAEVAVAQAEEEKKRARALDLLSRTVAGKKGETITERKASVIDDMSEEEQTVDADGDEDENETQPTLKGRQRRS